MAPPRGKPRVTLQEIARTCGVSMSTVSLTLSDKPGIAQETRERILETARALGYQFKAPPIKPPRKTIKTIGLVVSSLPESEPNVGSFYAHMIAAIEVTCQEMELNLMFANLLVDETHNPIKIPALLEKGEADGFLLAGIIVEEQIARVLDRRRLPVVLFESYSRARPYSAVLYDNFQGAYLATQHLIQKGHRHIAFVGGHASDYPSFRDRRAGYQKALADHGISPTYMADFAVYPAERDDILSAAMELVRANPQVSGLVCVNDDIAITVISGLSAAGYAVPGDISVVGFDDVAMAASAVPALTTMRVNKTSMGRLAVQMLLNQCIEGIDDSVTSLFRPLLVERSSVAEKDTLYP